MKTKEHIDNMYKSREFMKLSDEYIKDAVLLEELVELSVSDLPHPYPEYSSWLMIHIAKKSPEVLEPFQPKMIDRILVSTNQSVLRNLVNVSEMLPLIEYKESEYLDRLVHFITDDSNKVALFVYSIYKLIQFTHKYPEIKYEIEGIISLKQEPLKPAMRIGIRNYLKEVKNI